jgi:hypothetical protein
MLLRERGLCPGLVLMPGRCGSFLLCRTQFLVVQGMWFLVLTVL